MLTRGSLTLPGDTEGLPVCGARGLLSQRYLSFISVCGHRVQRGHLFLVARHNRQRSQQPASHHKPSPVSRHPWGHSRSTGTQHPESPRLVGREAQRATYMQECTRRTHQHPEGARGGGHTTVLRIPKVSLSLSHTHTRKCKQTRIRTPTPSWRRDFQIQRHWTSVGPV